MGFEFAFRYNCRRADKRVPLEFVLIYRSNTDVRVVRKVLVGAPLIEIEQIDGPVLVYLYEPLACRMKIAVLGVGRMGRWLVRELALRHEVCACDRDPARTAT